MEKEFIPYEQALALKGLGFDEPCIGFFENNGKNSLLVTDSVNFTNTDLKVEGVSSPLFQQAFRWFREKFDYHHTIQHNKKYIGIAYSSVVNFSIDEFNTYEEAELGCLKKLIEIVKK